MMELYLVNTSPYARAVRVFAIEKNIAQKIELRQSDPWTHNEHLLALSPVGRIPVLVTEEGVTLTESLLICQYLETQVPTPSLIPPATLAETLSLAGLGIGLMDVSFGTVISRKHDGPAADKSVLGTRRLQALERILARLEERIPHSSAKQITLGEIFVGVGLAYLSFRLPEINWYKAQPELNKWFEHISRRESFVLTAFQ